jgi:hypothetical protein
VAVEDDAMRVPTSARDQIGDQIQVTCGEIGAVANMASYAISSSLILVIHDNMIIGTNLNVSACLCRHF